MRSRRKTLLNVIIVGNSGLPRAAKIIKEPEFGRGRGRIPGNVHFSLPKDCYSADFESLEILRVKESKRFSGFGAPGISTTVRE